MHQWSWDDLADRGMDLHRRVKSLRKGRFDLKVLYHGRLEKSSHSHCSCNDVPAHPVFQPRSCVEPTF